MYFWAWIVVNRVLIAHLSNFQRYLPIAGDCLVRRKSSQRTVSRKSRKSTMEASLWPLKDWQKPPNGAECFEKVEGSAQRQLETNGLRFQRDIQQRQRSGRKDSCQTWRMAPYWHLQRRKGLESLALLLQKHIKHFLSEAKHGQIPDTIEEHPELVMNVTWII